MSAPGFGRGFSQAPPPAPPAPQVFTGLVPFGALAFVANGYLYWGAGATANASTVRRFWTVPFTGIIRNPTYWNQALVASAMTMTARLNNAPTAWVLATNGNVAGIQSAGAGDIVVAAGDEIDIRLTAGGSAAQCVPSYQFEYWRT